MVMAAKFGRDYKCDYLCGLLIFQKTYHLLSIWRRFIYSFRAIAALFQCLHDNWRRSLRIIKGNAYSLTPGEVYLGYSLHFHEDRTYPRCSASVSATGNFQLHHFFGSNRQLAGREDNKKQNKNCFQRCFHFNPPWLTVNIILTILTFLLYQPSTFFFNSFPTLKNGSLFGRTPIFPPVFGFLPV